MKSLLFEFNQLRMETSFNTLEELRLKLVFYQKNNIFKVNLPCKNNLRKDFLLRGIRLARKEFPDIDIIPHFSIQHQFRSNRIDTIDDFVDFFREVKYLGCKEVLLVSGSQKRATLDSLSALNFINNNPLLSNLDFSIGVAFNSYFPDSLFEEEFLRLEAKLSTSLITSIWLQFGTDFNLLESRIEKLNKLIMKTNKNRHQESNIQLYGSLLVPSRQFLARFKYRPWKGVICSKDFLESVESANEIIFKMLSIYKKYNIYPIVETDSASDKKLESLRKFLF